MIFFNVKGVQVSSVVIRSGVSSKTVIEFAGVGELKSESSNLVLMWIKSG